MEERDRELDRLLTFVDAIVAIAITLLVLPLVELAGDLDADEAGSVASLLDDHVAQLLAFFLSFAVIARLWLAQHQVLRGLQRPGRGVVGVLMLWTFTIVVLPFPTALAAQTDDDPLVITLYIGTMAISSALIAVLAALVARQPLAEGVEPPRGWAATINVGCLVLALVLALVVPGLGYASLLVLFAAGPLEALVRRSTAARSTAGPRPR